MSDRIPGLEGTIKFRAEDRSIPEGPNPQESTDVSRHTPIIPKEVVPPHQAEVEPSQRFSIKPTTGIPTNPIHPPREEGRHWWQRIKNKNKGEAT